MQKQHEQLLTAYRKLQEASEDIRRISARSPGTAPINDQLLTLNDTMSELIAEIAFLLERGELDWEAFAGRVGEILGPLNASHKAYLAARSPSEK